MRKDIGRRHDAQVRANNVCTEYSAIFDATPGGQTMRAALATHVADVDRLLAVQERSFVDRRAAAAQCRDARRALHDSVKAVVKVGKLVKVDETPMGNMPIPGKATDEQRLAFARGLLDRIAPHADVFVAAGLPADLVTDLGIQKLTAARDAQAAARQRFAAAAESIRGAQEQASHTIAALEAIAVKTPAANPEVLTKLRIAMRVGPRSAVARATPPAPAPAPDPPSATPADKAA